jgi:hypothetical protein
MPNVDNLQPVRSKKEARERGKIGGQKSGEARREKKQLREELILLLQASNTQEKISVALINEALKGNVKAFEVIRDTIGEKPVSKSEISGIEGGVSVIVNREAVQVESNN